MDARDAFVVRYGKPGERLDEDTWLCWLGIWASAWTDALEKDSDLCTLLKMIRAKTRKAMRSCGGQKWSLDKGELSGPLSYTADGLWVKFPNGVEFPLEGILDSSLFEIVIVYNDLGLEGLARRLRDAEAQRKAEVIRLTARNQMDILGDK